MPSLYVCLKRRVSRPRITMGMNDFAYLRGLSAHFRRAVGGSAPRAFSLSLVAPDKVGVTIAVGPGNPVLYGFGSLVSCTCVTP